MDRLFFRPKLLEHISSYNATTFRHDLIAGLTVGVVALPLAMAFGIATGVKPEQGIFTAIIAGFLISALGGSRVVVGGPTAAFIVILAGILQKYGAANLAICTMMAGAMLMVMGLARLGGIIKFIPYPLTMGFTCGIAVTIFGTQLKDFFGVELLNPPIEFLPRLAMTLPQLLHSHLPTVATAMVCVVFIVLWPKRLARWVPGSIVALMFATAATILFNESQGWGLKTIGSVFGGIPSSLPALTFPQVDWSTLKELLHPALTIALLAAIESLLCAVVADGMINDRHDSNQELMAQGIANLVVPLFGGIAATGAIVRTATNVRNGARTPVAGIIHALTLLAILLLAAPLARHIPMAALSAVLMVVAYNMGEWSLFSRLRRWPRSDMAVFLTAFGLTVAVDLVWAVIVGLLLAGALFVRRIAETTKITGEGAEFAENGASAPEGVVVFRILGAFFFGAANKLEDALEGAECEPEVLVLQMREALALDASGLAALESLHDRLRRHGKHLILCGPHTQPMFALQQSGFLDRIGMDNLCSTLEEAFSRARALMPTAKTGN